MARLQVTQDHSVILQDHFPTSRLHICLSPGSENDLQALEEQAIRQIRLSS